MKRGVAPKGQEPAGVVHRSESEVRCGGSRRGLSSIVTTMTVTCQDDVDQAYSLLERACAALYGAVEGDLEAALELTDAIGHAGRAQDHLLTAGAEPGAERPSVDPALPAEAVTRARDLLWRAKDVLPRADVGDPDVYEASAALLQAMHALRGWA